MPSQQVLCRISQFTYATTIDKEKRQIVGILAQINDPYQQRQDATRTQPGVANPATGGFGFAYDMDVVMEKLRAWGSL